MNLRPSGYEPDELPDCSTPRQQNTAIRDRRTGIRVLMPDGFLAVAASVCRSSCFRTRTSSSSRGRRTRRQYLRRPILGRKTPSLQRQARGLRRHSDGRLSVFGRPGGDLLFHTLRCSTIGAEGFHDRVRNGIGCRLLAITTRPAKDGNRHAASGFRHRVCGFGAGTWVLSPES